MNTHRISATWSALAPRLLSVLRIVSAFTFIPTGTMKLFAFPMGMPPDGSTAPLMSQTGIGFWPIVNQGVPAVLYCFIFLYFSAAGGGPWSVDALRKK